MLSFYYVLSHLLFVRLVGFIVCFCFVCDVGLACCYILFSATASRHVYHLFTPLKDHYTSDFFFYNKPVAVYITNQCEKLEEEKKSISYRNLLWMIKGKYKCWGLFEVYIVCIILFCFSLSHRIDGVVLFHLKETHINMTLLLLPNVLIEFVIGSSLISRLLHDSYRLSCASTQTYISFLFFFTTK